MQLEITLGLIKPSIFISYSCIKVIVNFDLSGYEKIPPLKHFFLPCCYKYPIESQKCRVSGNISPFGI